MKYGQGNALKQLRQQNQMNGGGQAGYYPAAPNVPMNPAQAGCSPAQWCADEGSQGASLPGLPYRHFKPKPVVLTATVTVGTTHVGFDDALQFASTLNKLPDGQLSFTLKGDLPLARFQELLKIHAFTVDKITYTARNAPSQIDNDILIAEASYYNTTRDDITTFTMMEDVMDFQQGIQSLYCKQNWNWNYATYMTIPVDEIVDVADEYKIELKLQLGQPIPYN